MEQALLQYVKGAPPEHRALFERIHRLIVEVCPDATVALSYKMPTYKVGTRRVHVGIWKGGVSIYGWKATGDAGFSARHPAMQTSTGTIRLRPQDAATVTDDEIRDLARCPLAQ